MNDSKDKQDGSTEESLAADRSRVGEGGGEGRAASEPGEEQDDELAVAELGTDRYVFAAFFAAGIGAAYLIGKTLAALWNTLAETPSVVRQVPQLLRLSEEERPTYTILVGVVVAVTLVAVYARKPAVRGWADGVAAELAKVHWPDKETVTNGTIVVIAAGLFATFYIGLLDRLWSFVTMLVYGA